jgi:hypothetical protein
MTSPPQHTLTLVGLKEPQQNQSIKVAATRGLRALFRVAVPDLATLTHCKGLYEQFEDSEAPVFLAASDDLDMLHRAKREGEAHSAGVLLVEVDYDPLGPTPLEDPSEGESEDESASPESMPHEVAMMLLHAHGGDAMAALWVAGHLGRLTEDPLWTEVCETILYVFPPTKVPLKGIPPELLG